MWKGKKRDRWEPWFRGQAEASQPLRPKLYRDGRKPNARLRTTEDEIREEFIKRAPLLCEASPAGDEKRAEWEWYFMMQHHGVATRLLDWSDGALIALYFAVRGNRGKTNAAVWVLDPYELNKRATRNWSFLSEVEKEWVIPPSAVGLYPPEVREEIDNWLPERFNNKEPLPQEALAIEPTHVVRRMSSQHSCFTVHGSDAEVLEELEKEGKLLFKIVVLKSAVNDITKDLRRCGIEESTIYPDLDGLARSINRRWQIW